jgi:hypothetical protein
MIYNISASLSLDGHEFEFYLSKSLKPLKSYIIVSFKIYKISWTSDPDLKDSRNNIRLAFSLIGPMLLNLSLNFRPSDIASECDKKIRITIMSANCHGFMIVIDHVSDFASWRLKSPQHPLQEQIHRCLDMCLL